MNTRTHQVLTAGGAWIADHWRVVRDIDQTDHALVLLPLASYLQRAQRLTQGVWLAPTDDPLALLPHLPTMPLIAIDFPVFTDGRGYSIASTLRNRYRYDGDLRAIGDVLIDQLFVLRRVGFSSFVLRADQDRDRAIDALRTFSEAYQSSADQPLPAFRRRVRPDAHGVPT